MGIEEMKTMKTQLMSCIQGQMGDLSKVNAEELGEAIDMIKDLSEAIYYCTITESMEKSEKEQPINNINYYTTQYPNYREAERNDGYMYYPRMYYNGGGSGGGNSGSGSSGGGNSGGGSSTSYYTEMPYLMRDPREGTAAVRRRMYMEGKEKHKDSKSQMRELEAYLEELSHDVTEMISDASPEEKATLQQKMMSLANKIN